MNNISNRHIASFVGLLLPFLAYTLLKDEALQLSEEDKKFVRNYIKLGWIFWGLVVLIAVLGLVSYFSLGTIGGIFNFLYQILIVVLIVYLIVVIFTIFSGKEINISISGNKQNIFLVEDILYYVPGYNFYLWYKYLRSEVKIDETKTYWLKESILWWFLIAVGGMLFGSLLMLVLIIRVVLLIFGIDIFSMDFKQKISYSFKNNPEEIFAYLVGLAFYLFGKVNKKYEISYIDAVLMLKEKYSKLYNLKVDFKNQNSVCVLLQNFIIFLFILFNIFKLILILDYLFGFNLGLYVTIIFVLFSRYFSLWYNRFMIRCPILDEICQLIFYILMKIIKPVG